MSIGEGWDKVWKRGHIRRELINAYNNFDGNQIDVFHPPYKKSVMFKSFLDTVLEDDWVCAALLKGEPDLFDSGSGERMLQKLICRFDMNLIQFRTFIELGCWTGEIR
jgi:hypothetical protein